MNTNLKKDQKNGIEKNAIAIAPAVAKSQQENASEAVKPTLEERIQKVEELRSLTMKRQGTMQTLHNIRGFHFASDENCVLELRDSQGLKFQTNNTNLITLLKDYFVTLLNEKVAALDKDILDFKL